MSGRIRESFRWLCFFSPEKVELFNTLPLKKVFETSLTGQDAYVKFAEISFRGAFPGQPGLENS